MNNKHSKEVDFHNEGHNYDGIQELNHPFPRWWVAIFLVTAIFAPVYLVWLHTPLGNASSIENEYIAKSESIRNYEKSSVKTADLAGLVKNEQAAEAGKSIFAQNCAACHGADGGGLVGPNLVDNFWIHGSGVQEVEKVISNGVAEKGMPGWKNILGTEKIRQTLSYIARLQGTTPAKPKVAEGSAGQLH